MPYEDMKQAATERLRQQEQNGHDLQNEIADRDVGRQKRYMVSGDPIAAQEEKKERDKLETLTALGLLLQDPEYAELYQQVSDEIAQAARIVEDELQKAQIKLHELNETQQDMLNDANRLADGTRVFKDEHGNVRSQDGEIITDQVMLDSIVWKDDAPSYEDYTENTEAIEETRNDIDELRRYEIEVIGTARERLHDEDDPPSKKELEQIREDLYQQAPEAMQHRLDADDVVADLPVGAPQQTAIPQL